MTSPTGKVVIGGEYEKLLLKLLKELDNQIDSYSLKYGEEVFLFPFAKFNDLIGKVVNKDIIPELIVNWIGYLNKLDNNNDIIDIIKHEFKNSRFEKILSTHKIGTISLVIDEFDKLNKVYPHKKELKVKYKKMKQSELSKCNTVIVDKDLVSDLESLALEHLKKELNNITNKDVKDFVEFAIWLHENIIKDEKEWKNNKIYKNYKVLVDGYIKDYINENRNNVDKVVKDSFEMLKKTYKANSPPTLPFSIKIGRILNKNENAIKLSVGLYGGGFGYGPLYYLLKMYVHGDDEIKMYIANLIKDFTYTDLCDEDIKTVLDDYAEAYIKVIESINSNEDGGKSDKNVNKNLQKEIMTLRKKVFIEAVKQLGEYYTPYMFDSNRRKSKGRFYIDKTLDKFKKAHFIFINADIRFNNSVINEKHINYFALELLVGSKLLYDEVNVYYIDISKLYENGYKSYINDNKEIDEVRTAIAALYLALDIYNCIKKNDEHYYIVVNLPPKKSNDKTTIHDLYYQMKEILGSERVQIQFLENYDRGILGYKSNSKFNEFLNYANECFDNLDEACKKLDDIFESFNGKYYKLDVFKLYEDGDIAYPFVYIEVGEDVKEREKYLISIPTVLTMANNKINDIPNICGVFKKSYLPKERNLYSSLYPYEFAINNICKNVDLCYITQYNREFEFEGKSEKIAYFEIKSLLNGELNYVTIPTPLEEDGDKLKLSKYAKKKLKKWVEPHKNVLLEVYRVKGIEEAEEMIKNINTIIREYFGKKLLENKNVYIVLEKSIYSCDEKNDDKKHFCVVEGLNSMFIAGVLRAKNKHRIYTQIARWKCTLNDVVEDILKMTYVFSEHDDFPSVVGLKRIINPDAVEKRIKAICLLCGGKLINNK